MTCTNNRSCIFRHKMNHKSLLNEKAQKAHIALPVYTNIASECGTLFIGTVVFDGKTYCGLVGRENKKEAEQFAAEQCLNELHAEGGTETCSSCDEKDSVLAQMSEELERARGEIQRQIKTTYDWRGKYHVGSLSYMD